MHVARRLMRGVRKSGTRVAGIFPQRSCAQYPLSNEEALAIFMHRLPPASAGNPRCRSAITFSARRALAAGIRRSTCSAAEAVYLERRDDQLAPDPARCFDCPVDPAPAAQ